MRRHTGAAEHGNGVDMAAAGQCRWIVPTASFAPGRSGLPTKSRPPCNSFPAFCATEVVGLCHVESLLLCREDVLGQGPVSETRNVGKQVQEDLGAKHQKISRAWPQDEIWAGVAKDREQEKSMLARRTWRCKQTAKWSLSQQPDAGENELSDVSRRGCSASR